MEKFYIRLQDNTHKEVSHEEFKNLFGNEMKLVKNTYVSGIFISTIFMGIDMSYGKSNKPVLYETMIFGGIYDQVTVRAKTYEHAIFDHNEAIKLVRSSGWIHSFVKVFDDIKKNTIKWINSEKEKV